MIPVLLYHFVHLPISCTGGRIFLLYAYSLENWVKSYFYRFLRSLSHSCQLHASIMAQEHLQSSTSRSSIPTLNMFLIIPFRKSCACCGHLSFFLYMVCLAAFGSLKGKETKLILWPSLVRWIIGVGKKKSLLSYVWMSKILTRKGELFLIEEEKFGKKNDSIHLSKKSLFHIKIFTFIFNFLVISKYRKEKSIEIVIFERKENIKKLISFPFPSANQTRPKFFHFLWKIIIFIKFSLWCLE